MDAWLVFAAKNAVILIETMALVVVCLGTVMTFFTGIPALLGRSVTDREIRLVWLRYAHWLVAGLTFQLAADIIQTAITPDWQDIGRLAAIALIRTFLDFFLVRDVTEIRGVQ